MIFIEQFDETLDINSTENYELSVQLGPDGFSYCLLDTLRNKFVLLRSHEPEENKYLNPTDLKNIIAADDFLSGKYKRTRMITPSRKFTLVPVSLYDPARKNEFFTLNHKTDENEVIQSNRLKDPEVFVLYSVQSSFVDLINEQFPGASNMIHLRPLLDHAAKSRRNNNGNYIHLHLERDFFDLIIFINSQLKFCNSFNYRNISDVLYYTMNIFNKLGVSQEETIYMSGAVEHFDDLSISLGDYVRSVKYAEPKGNFSFSYVFNEVNLQRFLNLINSVNCE